jgi:rhombotail lipoprotein
MRFCIVLAAAACLALTGCLCFSYGRRQYRSNLLDYLSPRTTAARRVSASSRLQLPLRIGIAFVPADNTPIDAESEQRLLEIVRKAFSGRQWVSDIRTIPSAYLIPHGGYDNLEQVSRMFGVDVTALVSVDQIQYNDPTALSILYITIVGQYVLPGDRDDTRTLIDVAVLDVASRNFVLRAPGTSRIRGFNTPVESTRRLRGKSDEGLRLAMIDLTKNLDTAVSSFKTEVAAGQRADVDIITREGKSVRGGGAFDPLAALLVVAAAAIECGAWRASPSIR